MQELNDEDECEDEYLWEENEDDDEWGQLEH